MSNAKLVNSLLILKILDKQVRRVCKDNLFKESVLDIFHMRIKNSNYSHFISISDKKHGQKMNVFCISVNVVI